MITKSSCYNCQERNPGCHSYCETYLKFKNHLEFVREKRKEYNESFPSHKKAKKY